MPGYLFFTLLTGLIVIVMLVGRKAELALQKGQLTSEMAHLLLLERLMWLRLLSRFKQRSQVAATTLEAEVPGLTFGAQLGDY